MAVKIESSFDLAILSRLRFFGIAGGTKKDAIFEKGLYSC
jgi:hypothetical protein